MRSAPARTADQDVRAAQTLRTATVGLSMILLPLALDTFSGDSTVTIGLVITVAVLVGGGVVGVAVSRALHGETLRRHDERIKKNEETLEKSPPAVIDEKVKELTTWKQGVDRQLQEFEILHARLDERSASTVRGVRTKTGRNRSLDPE